MARPQHGDEDGLVWSTSAPDAGQVLPTLNPETLEPVQREFARLSIADSYDLRYSVHCTHHVAES